MTNGRLDGINIHEAVSILSSRQKEGSNVNLVSSEGCGHKRCPPPSSSSGQTIHLGPTPPSDHVDPSLPSSAEISDDLAIEKSRRRAAFEETYSSASSPDLLRTALSLQSERVQAYVSWGVALDGALSSGNISVYAGSCPTATVSFSTISERIRAVGAALVGRAGSGAADASRAVRALQEGEREKLNLTAALHLERLRRAGVVPVEGDKDERTNALLEGGVRDLEQRLGLVVEGINDVLEELKGILTDEMEE
eukprot:CAMPEP_0194280808 /NCGR_PEP_ID=MMETSP0169-20130528/18906_1 /TAXON_ID=218684 /ORGANISM="Corethron pennatum, Strain L29A3" /LENGTH=251 /DNA_ID=CAMNT_0039025677 /DNA_START=49 /DNA_END=804 /DNA_ORIENTATION=-